MTATILGWTLLTVATISLTVYAVALTQLLRRPRRPGLVRTAACRVLAAVLYVGVAVATLLDVTNGPLIGLGVFTSAQILWQLNALADLRLTRPPGRADHRGPQLDGNDNNGGLDAPARS